MSQRVETFAVDRRGDLVRRVTPSRGRPYAHRVRLANFETILYAAQEAGAAGFTLEELVAATGLPHTQAAVALAFLKERGTVVVEGRRSYPAWDVLYEDGMLEYHALREAPEDSPKTDSEGRVD